MVLNLCYKDKQININVRTRESYLPFALIFINKKKFFSPDM